ncbi:hypothetical protein FCL40_12150 [Ferrimonas sediminicola]|uniref:Lipoprotein n=1 Tax=Ferrimonas sediminicola TaxID=2569538 RepID=A0A4U1BD25_9GAMM|nr:hypothetical protein [Ferrimonas sediminicola]TKB48456.1 hypothetical protein FCL40_12150 [Ferrimonas sediminicola]
MRVLILALSLVLSGCATAPHVPQVLDVYDVVESVEADEFELCFKVPVGKHLAGPVVSTVSYTDEHGDQQQVVLSMEFASKSYLPALKGILMFRHPEYEYHYRLTPHSKEVWKRLQQELRRTAAKAELRPYPDQGLWHHDVRHKPIADTKRMEAGLKL